MQIRSQIDTSIYNQPQRGGRIGDLLSLVQGVQSIAGTVRQRRKENKAEDDNTYLNDIYSKYFSDWDGVDQADFQRRNRSVMAEISRERSDLYSQALGISGEFEKAMSGRQTAQIEQAGKILDLEGKQVDIQNKRLDRTKKFFENHKWKVERIGEELADVTDEQSYNNALQAIKMYGIDTPLPDYQTFLQNPHAHYSRVLAEKQKVDKTLKDIDLKMKGFQSKKTEKELEWFDRTQRARIGALNRSGTGSQIPSGSNEGLSDMDLINAQTLAREIGGVRGMKTVLPQIVKAMKSGMTIDQIRDERRYAQQSGDFSGAAREGMQQLYAGKSGKAADAAFDAFDDLLAKGDQKAMAGFLKRSAQNTAGTSEAAQIRGTERTLDFISEIEADLDTYELKGGDTNIFSGTVENFRKKLGYVKDEEMRKIAEKIHTAIMKYRRAMSGAAFSVPESKEYADIFPSITRTSNLNSASINALKEVFSGDLSNFYIMSMGENAYNTFIGGGVTSPSGSDIESTSLQPEQQQLQQTPSQQKPRKIWNPATNRFELR